MFAVGDGNFGILRKSAVSADRVRWQWFLHEQDATVFRLTEKPSSGWQVALFVRIGHHVNFVADNAPDGGKDIFVFWETSYARLDPAQAARGVTGCNIRRFCGTLIGIETATAVNRNSAGLTAHCHAKRNTKLARVKIPNGGIKRCQPDQVRTKPQPVERSINLLPSGARRYGLLPLDKRGDLIANRHQGGAAASTQNVGQSQTACSVIVFQLDDDDIDKTDARSAHRPIEFERQEAGLGALDGAHACFLDSVSRLETLTTI